MLKRNFELRTMARVSLSGQWLTAALVTLVIILFSATTILSAVFQPIK